MAKPCDDQAVNADAFMRSDGPEPYAEVQKDARRPFIHRFWTQRFSYVYDVNTRRIIRVSAPVWDVLQDFGAAEDATIVSLHSPHHGTDAITRAIRQIHAAQSSKGLFLPHRPQRVLPPAREMIRQHLENRRQQLILNVTENCNFRCSYCVFGGAYPLYRRHSTRRMSWAIAKKAVDDFLLHSRSSEAPCISFYGGEPLLHISLIQKTVGYVQQISNDSNISFMITTNGYLLRGQAADYLAANGFGISVSLDGPRQTHDKHRRTASGRPTWSTVTSNIRRFLNRHPDYRTNGKLRFNAVATRSTNLEEVQAFFCTDELVDDSMGIQVDEQIELPESLPPGRQDASSETIRRLYHDWVHALICNRVAAERRQTIRRFQNSLFEKYFILFHKRGFARQLPSDLRLLNTCIPGARRTFVSTKGNYCVCERVDSHPDGVIGHVEEGIDVGKVARILSKWARANQAACRFCWCLPTCRIGCFATIATGNGSFTRAKKLACAVCRRSSHELLVHYSTILEDNPRAFDYMADLTLQ